MLTEQQLLLLQSQGRCRNVFLNSLPVTVQEGEEGGVEYCFNSVTDVNMFLFKVTNAKALGFVERTSRNMIFLKIVPDDDGYFKLITEQKVLPVAMCEQHGFRTKAIRAGEEQVCLQKLALCTEGWPTVSFKTTWKISVIPKSAGG